MDGVEQIVTETARQYQEKVAELTQAGWQVDSAGNDCTALKKEFPGVDAPTNYIRTMNVERFVEVYAPGYAPAPQD